MAHFPGERSRCVLSRTGRTRDIDLRRQTHLDMRGEREAEAGGHKRDRVRVELSPVAGDGGGDRGHGASERRRRRPRQRDGDGAVGREELILLRLDERLHPRARREPAHACGLGELLPAPWGGADDDDARASSSTRDDAERDVRARLREAKRARPVLVTQHDALHGVIERDRHRLAGGHLEPAAAECCARGDHVERCVGGVADEPAGPGGALHRDVDRQRLARRHRFAGPELPVAEIDCDRLAAARVHGHLFDAARIGRLLDGGERVAIGSEADLGPGEESRCGRCRTEKDDRERPQHGLATRPPSRSAAVVLNRHASCIPRRCEGNAIFGPRRHPAFVLRRVRGCLERCPLISPTARSHSPSRSWPTTARS